MKDYRVSKDSGFTLIELLVVIAIIAILAAILFPVFAQAREKARAISCISNEKQLAMATLMYVGDYDELWPFGVNGDSGGYAVNQGWAGLVYPYLKNVGVLHCPDDQALVSYAINENFMQTGEPDSPPFAGNLFNGLPSMGGPASTVMYCEVDNSLPNGYQVAGWFTWDAADIEQNFDPVSASAYGQGSPWGMSNNVTQNPGGVPWYGVTYATGPMCNDPQSQTFANDGSSNWGGATGPINSAARHTGGSNFAMCDGHAKWAIGTSVSGGYGPSLADVSNWFGGNVNTACSCCQMSVPVEDLGTNAPACGSPSITWNTF